jgi:hypothetical protein
MRATRTLIEIFLPRMALRRRPAAIATARESRTSEPSARLSLACEPPELRGAAFPFALEPHVPVPSRTAPESFAASNAQRPLLTPPMCTGITTYAGASDEETA